MLPVQTLMEELEPEEQFLQCARNGDLPGIQRLLMSKIKEETRLNINCKGGGRPLLRRVVLEPQSLRVCL